MITVVAESVHTYSPSVYGPFDTREAAAKWLHARAKTLLDELEDNGDHFRKDKWELPKDQQEMEYAELTEDEDAVTWWRVVETTLPEEAG